ncbi:PRC-barrel domain-containing protein [Arthrobacter sp. KN11-1C]|uniref:PRC-barrel domain-containing protein n=1 Tax=Arthrobacter sp. KN11-1C TaxID=3445774 RepID=UPI003FA120AC
MLSLQDIDNIVLNGGIVVDSAGEKIGSVEQVFTSGDSGDPVFVTVRTGLFGMSESFAPLSGASLEDSVIKVAFAKDKVKNGPRIESDRGVITETQEQELYSYYGLVAEESNDAATANDTEDAGLASVAAPVDAVPGENAPKLPLPIAHGEPHPPHGGPPPPHPTHGGPHPPHGGPHPPHPPHLHKHVPRPPHPGPRPHRPPGPSPEPGDRQ